MNLIGQIVTAFLGSAGFAIIFHVKWKCVFYAAVGGLVCWAVYLLAQNFATSDFLPTTAAGAAITIYAEAMARICKTPASQFLISGLIPLVPGGSLYYCMSGLVQKNWAEASSYGSATAVCVLGIAVGISATLSLWDMMRRIRREVFRHKKSSE